MSCHGRCSTHGPWDCAKDGHCAGYDKDKCCLCGASHGCCCCDNPEAEHNGTDWYCWPHTQAFIELVEVFDLAKKVKAMWPVPVEQGA